MGTRVAMPSAMVSAVSVRTMVPPGRARAFGPMPGLTGGVWQQAQATLATI